MEFFFPNSLKYTRTHEWLSIEDDKVRVGITDYGQKEIGEVLYVEYLFDDEVLDKMSLVAKLETPKQIKEIFLPITGIILETNLLLREEPELINNEPYANGWIVLLDPTKSYEINQFMGYLEYKEYVETLLKQYNRSFWYEEYEK